MESFIILAGIFAIIASGVVLVLAINECWKRHLIRRASNLGNVRKALAKEEQRKKRKQQTHMRSELVEHIKCFKFRSSVTTTDKNVAKWFEERGYEVKQTPSMGVWYYTISVPPLTDKELSDLMLE